MAKRGQFEYSFNCFAVVSTDEMNGIRGMRACGCFVWLNGLMAIVAAAAEKVGQRFYYFSLAGVCVQFMVKFKP